VIDFVGLAIVLLLALLFGYLTVRAWRSRRGVLKWVGLVLAGLLTLVFAIAFIMAVLGTLKLNANLNAMNPVREFNASTATAEQIAFGQKFAMGCAGCHSANQQPPLSGNNFGAEIGFPIGTLYAPNLTPGGEIKDWTDGEIVRAIREGVHKSGRPLIIMPAQDFHALSDEDVIGLVAYLRSQPAVEPDTPRNGLNVIGALLSSVLPALTNQPHIPGPVAKPAVGVTAEYGKYLVDISACRGCHGQALHGGNEGFSGPAPSLLAAEAWSDADFVKFFHSGTRPDGSMVSDAMPWKYYGETLSDTDLNAIHAYLQTVR
jgi:mono/diheme cytochrome c family protein